MRAITFEIEDEKATRLAKAARERGVSVEELLQQIVDDFLSRQDNFDSAAIYVLEKNAELHRRLAD